MAAISAPPKAGLPLDHPLEEVRRMAHDAIDEWVDTLAPFFEEDREVSLCKLSEHITRTRSQLSSACMKAAIDKRWKEEQYDKLAHHLRAHLDMKRIYQIIGL